jgi:propanol-preferring alcohol dehydrogenase
VTTSNWGSRNDLEEVVALARSGALRATSERFPLSEINAVFEMLRAGRVAGRAVLVP